MKQLVNKLLLIPIFVFTIFIFVVLGIFYELSIKFMDSYFQEETEELMQREKEYVKKHLFVIRDSLKVELDNLYSILIKNMENNLNQFMDSYIDTSKHIFIQDIDANTFYIYFKKGTIPIKREEKYSYIIYDGVKYLFVYKYIDDKVYGVALSDNYLQKVLTKFIFQYLDRIHKYIKPSYVAVGKVTTLNPKNGIFGYILYMPPKLRDKVGSPLNLYKGDIKGNLFRKSYFEAYKSGKDSIILSYYYKNPKTGKIEQKTSYFVFLRDYHLVLVEGVYKSRITKLINKEYSILKNIMDRYTLYIVILILIGLVVVILLSIWLSRKIIYLINKEFNELKSSCEESQAVLLQKLYYDDVTKLPNRVKLIKDLEKYNSLIIVDIDNFGLINDIYGFEFGDEVLKSVANLLIKKFDNIYRIGSDEFAIASIVKVDKESLEKIALMHYKYDFISLTFSIGGSNSTPNLLPTAEMALKKAKHDKYKKYFLYDETIFEEQKSRVEKIEFLKHILRIGDIYPFYQCIVDRDGNIVKYEALMRLKDNNKIYTPYYFLELIHEAKLYDQFARVMIKNVVDDIKNGVVDNVSINLSFEDISNISTKEFIYSIITEEIASKITIEILESEGVENYKEVKEFLDILKSRGVKVAIDDFGSGYSNFVQILKISPDYIKIDGSLIKNLHDKKYLSIVKLIIQFAKEFNITIVAEFVDNEENFKILKELGVDMFQGYYFCEPKELKV